MFTLEILFLTTLWLVKVSVWFFMKRLMFGKWMNITAYGALAWCLLSYIVVLVFNFGWCAPISSIYDLGPNGLYPR